VLSGGTAHVNVDDKWTAYEQEERRAVDLEGHPLEARPSTLGVAQELVEASVERLLDCTTSVVYQLETDTIGAALEKALAEGKIFTAPFLYRDGLPAGSVFPLKNARGVFPPLGRPARLPFVRREALPEPETVEQEDELDADLDFSMM